MCRSPITVTASRGGWQRYREVDYVIAEHAVWTAQHAATRYEGRAAELSTIEYHREWTASMWSATRSEFTSAELEAVARTQLWKAKKRLRAIEDGARAEGFRSAAQREQRRFLDEAEFVVRVMGGFGVGA